MLCTGDHVEWQSHCSPHMFRGVIEGFFGKRKDVAFCTDQTGRRSRPVAVNRLQRVAVTHWYSGRAA
jgi:hypothetical protein